MASDDQVIIVSGGSLHVSAQSGTAWQQAPAGSPNWVHYERGVPSARNVTAIDIVYADNNGDPAHERKTFLNQKVTIDMSNYNGGSLRAGVSLETDQNGRGLTYISGGDKPANPQPHVLKHSRDDWSLREFTINGTRYACGKNGRFTLIVHYCS